jgi:hypothetical protein
MSRHSVVAVSFVALVCMLLLEGTRDAGAASKLPDPVNGGVA